MSLTCMCTYPYTDNIDAYKGEEKKSWFAYIYTDIHVYLYLCRILCL